MPRFSVTYIVQIIYNIAKYLLKACNDLQYIITERLIDRRFNALIYNELKKKMVGCDQINVKRQFFIWISMFRGKLSQDSAVISEIIENFLMRWISYLCFKFWRFRVESEGYCIIFKIWNLQLFETLLT